VLLEALREEQGVKGSAQRHRHLKNGGVELNA
jgi:hypothetical protein